MMSEGFSGRTTSMVGLLRRLRGTCGCETVMVPAHRKAMLRPGTKWAPLLQQHVDAWLYIGFVDVTDGTGC